MDRAKKMESIERARGYLAIVPDSELREELLRDLGAIEATSPDAWTIDDEAWVDQVVYCVELIVKIHETDLVAEWLPSVVSFETLTEYQFEHLVRVDTVALGRRLPHLEKPVAEFQRRVANALGAKVRKETSGDAPMSELTRAFHDLTGGALVPLYQGDAKPPKPSNVVDFESRRRKR